MKEEYIVRADFYPDGEIIPLGITDCQGNTIYVKKSKMVFSNGKDARRFECVAESRHFSLEFRNSKWYVGNINCTT